MALENLPKDIRVLAADVLHSLRTSDRRGFDALSSAQQRAYDELAGLCIRHFVQYPAPTALRRLGPSEDAYGIDILREDRASLRVNYYTQAGTHLVTPGALTAEELDVKAYGTPHNHIGHIAAAVPIGTLAHHTFKETTGNSYQAGSIQFTRQPNGTSSSQFMYERTTGLTTADAAAFDAQTGYRMDRDTIHVVTWSEPTITVWFNDAVDAHRSTTYAQEGLMQDERPRHLGPEEQAMIWSSLQRLITNEVA